MLNFLVKPLFNTIDVVEDLSSISAYDSTEEVDPESVGISKEGAAVIWSGIEGLYKTGLYPAITFCLRRRGGIVFKRAIGHARGNGPHDAPGTAKVLAKPDTPICIFSSSKVFTAMLIHKLAEQGKISLLDTIAQYIPEFGANGKDKIIIYQMLAHLSAIPKLPEGTSAEALADPDAMVGLLCEAKPSLRAGRDQAYHAITSGYIFGELVKRVTGAGIQDYWRECVKEPMGMRFFDYGIALEDMGEMALNYMTGPKLIFPFTRYERHVLGFGFEEVVKFSNEPFFYSVPLPAANMVATAEEVSRFFQMLLDQGKWGDQQILEPMTIHRAILEARGVQFDKSLMLPMRYSAGMMLGGSPIGLFGPMTDQAYGHVGLINILNWADPERDISVALLTTGKPLIAHHGVALVKVLKNISQYCERN